MTKFIFVTGGVTSSLGKGILCASIAKLLQSRGFNVTIQKLEPYINIDAGTMSPMEHGECFVTEDGVETDLDLGHYERFLDIKMSRHNYITTGSVYYNVISKEREGGYLGKNIQVVPHITDEIKNRILNMSDHNYDFIISEVGGCVGDIESLPYIEAIRQLKLTLGKNNFLSVHLTLVPYLTKAAELKTKPTQHSVRELQSLGIQPDIIVCRSEKALTNTIKDKISLFCNVDKELVFESPDVETIYEVPIKLYEQKLDTSIISLLDKKNGTFPDLTKWNNFLTKYKKATKIIKIALVGKYVEVPDSYKSILEALVHASVENEVIVKTSLISSFNIERSNVSEILSSFDGIVIGPGYGERGVQGKINAIEYARINNIPLFGICLGMQCMIIEFSRNILGYIGANSTEFDLNTPYNVIDLMESQKNITAKGATNRLGVQSCKLLKDTIAFRAYKDENINERHRHRYEFNDKFKNIFLDNGVIFSGKNTLNDLVEIIEVKNHKWAVGTQFHPELISSPQNPHPLFVDFIKAANV